MKKKIFSCSFSGLNCDIVEVEADISNGLPTFTIVGLGDISVQEAKERVRASIKNSGADFPQNRKIINLAPAEIRKQGSHFDLPIAVSILLESGQIRFEKIENSIFAGELSLDGKIKGIHGALLITQYAKEKGFKKIFLPQANALEAAYVHDIEIYPVNSLIELIEFCNKGKIIKRQESLSCNLPISETNYGAYSQLIGLEMEKRVLSISAAGGHNLLMSGPPGMGKTFLARAYKDLLPVMEKSESMESTKIFSIAGLLDEKFPFITNRPFREVHHTASVVSIIGGGGKNPRPGEITLAHNGVLFLDEITEFPRSILESLRQPLEDKYISLNRSNFAVKFPSNFTLLATMNPCPCGYLRTNNCRCLEYQILNYQKRISGPLLDRFDLMINVEKVTIQNLFDDTNSSLKVINETIHKSREIQRQRYEYSKCKNNSDMGIDEIKKFCVLNSKIKNEFDHSADNMNISNRGYIKILKVTRTIADLDGSENIKREHLMEAIQYRQNLFRNVSSR